MESLTTMLRSLRERLGSTQGALPEEAMCRWCQRVSREWEGLDAALADRGLDRQQAHDSLCDCEERRACQEQARAHLLNLPHGVGGKTFDTLQEQPGNAGPIRVAREMLETRSPLLLTVVGDVGRGKSHLLEAMGNELFARRLVGRYDTVVQVLYNLRDFSETIFGEQESEVWRHFYQRVPWLLLDDLGVEKDTDWAVEQLTHVIDTRLQAGLNTVVATNLGVEAVQRRFGGIEGRRLASRMFGESSGEARACYMTTPDWRQR